MDPFFQGPQKLILSLGIPGVRGELVPGPLQIPKSLGIYKKGRLMRTVSPLQSPYHDGWKTV